MEKRKNADWEAIEREYRTGQLSIRELGRKHAVSDTAIRKRAKTYGWQQDLTARVKEKVRNDLVRDSVRTPDARTDKEIVDAAAATAVEVVRSHRKDIGGTRLLFGALAEQLKCAVQNRDDLEAVITDETKEDSNTKRRQAMLKAISLPAHAGVLRDLTAALKNIVSLERQAFNLDADGGASEDSWEEHIKRIQAAKEAGAE